MLSPDASSRPQSTVYLDVVLLIDDATDDVRRRQLRRSAGGGDISNGCRDTDSPGKCQRGMHSVKTLEK